MPATKRNRVYADTSVFGGVFDPEFAAVSQRFFDEVRAGKHVVWISEMTSRELERAPIEVKQFVASLPHDAVEYLPFAGEMRELRNAYIAARVVGPASADDAAHVAAATVARADIIISGNFRHIVKWDRIRAFNAVNLSLGYPVMTILSPREVISDEETL